MQQTSTPVKKLNQEEEPSEQVVNFILNYSKALSVRKLRSGKKVRTILN
jgi:hypothetical protein